MPPGGPSLEEASCNHAMAAMVKLQTGSLNGGDVTQRDEALNQLDPCYPRPSWPLSLI